MSVEAFRKKTIVVLEQSLSLCMLIYENIFEYFFIPSIKNRVLIWFGLMSAFILFLFSTAFYYFLEQNINLKIQESLYNKAIIVKDGLILGFSTKEIFRDSSLNQFDIEIHKNGEIVGIKGNTRFDYISTKINLKGPFSTYKNGENINAIYILNIKKPFVGKIYILRKNLDNKAENIEDTLLILIPILLLLLIFLASRSIDKILIPIKNITKTANEITVSDFSKSIKRPKDNDEIRALVDSFNKMIKRLKNGVEKIERFNNDVSHELKTPLTIIKGEVEITLDRLRDTNEYIKSMKIIDEEAEQIKKIVDGLLLLTKYSKINIQNSYEIFSLETILLKVVKKYNKALKEKNISLYIDKLENITIKANSILIETIFSNLIDNAIKYTLDNKNINISLYQDSKIHFIIKDEGIGIAKEKLCFITDRFYRADESRNKKIKGFGLGLSIVKNSVELHGGILHVDSQIGVGSSFHVEI